MSDPVQEFQETLILRQGLIRSFVFHPPRTSVHFDFPKLFDIQFIRVVDYRANLPLSFSYSIREWSASRGTEFLRGVPERRRRFDRSPMDDLSQLCHFHMTFEDGYVDVLAEDFVFMMVSR